MSADPFSDILRFTKAEALTTGGFTAGGRWALRFPAPKNIKFFAVVKGGCWVRLDGEPEPMRFETGDVGLLAAPRAFILASDPDVEPLDAMTVFAGAGRTTKRIGEGEQFEHVGGHVWLDPTSGRLLADVLPPWVHVRADSLQAGTLQWLLARLVEERTSDLPGAEVASAQIAQLFFIQILRLHLAAAEFKSSGWLGALRDPRLAPAMRLMHADPARTWRLDELASACAMSRTTFASRFKQTAGITPLAYLAQWRMRLAECALREDSAPVSVVARQVGFSSESAFSNAVKRATGQSPKAFRHSRKLDTPYTGANGPKTMAPL